MTAIHKAIETAILTLRPTSWEAGPIYDHSEQRYHKKTICDQLKEQILESRTHIVVMLAEWAFTGKWSNFQKAPRYFVHEILIWARAQNIHRHSGEFPPAPPPWKSKYVVYFLDATVYGWFRHGVNDWIRDRGTEFYEIQESTWNSHYPYD